MKTCLLETQNGVPELKPVHEKEGMTSVIIKGMFSLGG